MSVICSEFVDTLRCVVIVVLLLLLVLRANLFSLLHDKKLFFSKIRYRVKFFCEVKICYVADVASPVKSSYCYHSRCCCCCCCCCCFVKGHLFLRSKMNTNTRVQKLFFFQAVVKDKSCFLDFLPSPKIKFMFFYVKARLHILFSVCVFELHCFAS